METLFFLLNSDTLLLNNAVKKFFDAMLNADLNVACMGALLKDKNLNIIHSYGNFPTIISTLRDALRAYWAPFIPQKAEHLKHNCIFPLEVDYVTGADVFIRREVIEELGLFDPDFLCIMRKRKCNTAITMIIINQ
ncbi:MAG: hypothetical protein LUE99_06420 [Bacteroides sp.]|nr:hypothetical protein [Bacteroides sp.]